MLGEVLVTGGAGFIGGWLVQALLDAGTSVHCVDKLSYASNPHRLKRQADLGLNVHELDICDRQALDTVFDEVRPNVVFHLAAESHVDRSIDSPAPFLETNVTGTFELLGASLEHWQSLSGVAADDFRFIHASTDEVFGEAQPGELFAESSPYSPRSPYAASKAASDHLVRSWAHTYGLPTLVTNCSNNYGPWQFPEKLIPNVIVRTLNGDTLRVYGDGQQVRDWIHVEDHVKALIRVAEAGEVGGTYLVGSRDTRTNLSVVELVCDVVDQMTHAARPSRTLIRHVADRPGHDQRYALDPSSTELLGWTAGTEFDEGLRATIQWYLANEQWWSPLLRDGAAMRRGVLT